MFTSTRQTALAAILMVALVAGFSSPSWGSSKDDLERQRKSVQGELGSAQKDFHASNAKYAAAVKALDEAQGRLDAAEAKLADTRGALAVAEARDREMQEKLAQSEADLKKAIAELEKGEADLAVSQAAVEEFAVNNIQRGNPGLRAFSGLLSGQDPAAFSEQMSLDSAVSEAQVTEMQQLEATRIMLELKRDAVEELRDAIAVQRAEAAANLVKMTELEAAAEEQATAVGELVSVRASASKDAEALRAADEAEYQALVAERRSLESRIAAIDAKNRSDGGASAGGDSGGALSRPVGGPITSPYGMRRHPITGVYKLHDGTDFGVGCGTPIKAAASGTISQQYFNGAYGNRVILNNGVKKGKSIVTTYNHLSRFALSAGAKVKRGQVIGYVGTTGYSTGCHLHWMVLADGATTNPTGWL